MPDTNSHTENLSQKLLQALLKLKEQDYSGYLESLARLGDEMRGEFAVKSVKELESNLGKQAYADKYKSGVSLDFSEEMLNTAGLTQAELVNLRQQAELFLVNWKKDNKIEARKVDLEKLVLKQATLMSNIEKRTPESIKSLLKHKAAKLKQKYLHETELAKLLAASSKSSGLTLDQLAQSTVLKNKIEHLISLDNFEIQRTEAKIEAAKLADEAIANELALEAAELQKIEAEMQAHYKLVASYDAVSKNHLTKDFRHKVHFGQLAILDYLQKSSASADVSVTEDADNKMREAISSRQSGFQKSIHVASNGLVLLTSIAFGAIEGGTAMFTLGLGLIIALGFTPVGWPLAILLLGVAAVAGAAVFINYKSMHQGSYNIFKGFFGLDKLFQNFRDYEVKLTTQFTVEENGKRVQKSFSRNVKKSYTVAQKLILVGFTAFLAFPTGVGIAALGFTSTLAIPHILLILGLSLGPAMLAFPPLAIGVAVVVAIVMTAFCVSGLTRIFSSYLQYKAQLEHSNQFKSEEEKEKPNFFKFILGDALEMINSSVNSRFNVDERPTANKVAKGVSYAFMFAICLLSTVGLAVAAKTGAMSLAVMMHKVFKLAVPVSNAVGIAVGGIGSFLGRVFKTVELGGQGSAVIVEQTVKPSTDESKRTVNLKVAASTVVDVSSEAFFYGNSLLHSAAGGNGGALGSASPVMATGEAGLAAVRSTMFGLTEVCEDRPGQKSKVAQEARVAVAAEKSTQARAPKAPQMELVEVSRGYDDRITNVLSKASMFSNKANAAAGLSSLPRAVR